MKSITKSVVSAFVTISFSLWHATNAVAWQAPIGIPTPPFGISETAPAPPSPWDATNTTSGGKQFYFVCPTCPGSTDTLNPYGYPAKPRKSILFTLPAGSVETVEKPLIGVYLPKR